MIDCKESDLYSGERCISNILGFKNLPTKNKFISKKGDVASKIVFVVNNPASSYMRITFTRDATLSPEGCKLLA